MLFTFIQRVRGIVALFVAALGMHSALAECHFTSPDANPIITLTLPSQIVVEPDAPVGTSLYVGSAVGESHHLDCTGSTQEREGYLYLTDNDSRDVLLGVYQTSVPGIGIRVARSNQVVPAFSAENMVTPMHYVGIIRNQVTWDSQYNVKAQLVIIGKVESGTLDTSRLTADFLLDDLLAASLRFSPTHVRVLVNTCNLASKNINVPLNDISPSAFNGDYSAILTDDSFKIEVSGCTEGTQVDYKFTSSGSTGVTDGNILNIEKNAQAASGVGIQILDSHNNVLNFDQQYTGLASVSDGQIAQIPLKARYVKTGAVRSGRVDAVATFEVYYR